MQVFEITSSIYLIGGIYQDTDGPSFNALSQILTATRDGLWAPVQRRYRRSALDFISRRSSRDYRSSGSREITAPGVSYPVAGVGDA